ncbi:MAG: Gldg family protein [SAR324 cluster bacterium]
MTVPHVVQALRVAALRPLLTVAGGGLLYGGERLAAATPARPWLSGSGALLVLAGAAWSAVSAWRSGRAASAGRGARARAQLWTLVPQGAFLASGAAYGAGLLIRPGPSAAAWAGVLRFAWALGVPMGAVLWGFVETAHWRLGALEADRLSAAARMNRAAAAGLWLALLLGLVATVNFAGTRLNWQWDVAYFKTSEPSDATRKAAGALSEPVRAGVFFPGGNPVGEQVDAYFRQLTRAAPNLSAELMDADLEPAQAQAFQARGNGWVILKRGDQLRPMALPTQLDQARNALRRFDTDLLKNLLEVSREPRVVYTTVGHGERFESGRSAASPEGSDRYTAFEAFLRTRNLKVQPLDYARGLGSAIPGDAFLVIVAGPSEPFSRGEADALRRYLQAGGRLMVFLEPGDFPAGTGPSRRRSRGSDPLLAVLGGYGVQFDPAFRANERIFGRRTYTEADHGLLVTIAYEAHPVTAPMRTAPNQFPLVLMGAGALKLQAAPAGLKVQALVNAMPGTFADINRNFRFDPPAERMENAVLVAAVAPEASPSPPPPTSPGRSVGPYLLVYADADMASDLLVGNRANAMLVSAGLEWLSGQEPAGAPNAEEDQPIQHMRGDEWLWFYLPVAAVPLAVLGAGMWRLRRKSRMPSATAGAS